MGRENVGEDSNSGSNVDEDSNSGSNVDEDSNIGSNVDEDSTSAISSSDANIRGKTIPGTTLRHLKITL